MGIIIFMLSVFVVTVTIVMNLKPTKVVAPPSELLRVHTRRKKDSTRFDMAVPLHLTLILERFSWWRRLLSPISFFRPPLTGDAKFDARFTVTAYREDVLAMLRADARWRQTILSLAEGIPALSLFGIENGRLYLTVGTAKDVEVEAAHRLLGLATYEILRPFMALPADTPQQARSYKRDGWLLAVPVVTAASAFLVAMRGSPPLAATAGVWQYQIWVGLIFFVLHMGVVASLAQQAAARMNLTMLVLFTALFFGAFLSRGLLVEINASKPRATLVEVTRVGRLSEVDTPKSSSRYYLGFSSKPTSLIADASDQTGASMEIDSRIFQSLVQQKVDAGSVVAVQQAVGWLGLPYVVWVGPVRNDDGQVMHRP